ncbi:four helix bundle protein [Pirellulimonas nuda]|uniref:four helix bundle protein n=1 Tax=Pirellulimonas nuda TaxID=2528009 RepID=UPI0028F3E6F0|nr:four helix bundle protein [Pirellulimonas nuda]
MSSASRCLGIGPHWVGCVVGDVRGHQDLQVWQEAITLVDAVYTLCTSLPSDERYGLKSQMQRAAVSVPANVAEGAARDSTREFLRFLSISRGSLAELTTYFVICERRGMLDAESLADAKTCADRVGRMLTGLQRSLARRRDAQDQRGHPPPR